MPNVWRVVGRWLRLRRRLWRWGRAATSRPWLPEQPLRSQLFSAEQMEVHGGLLAKAHRVRDQAGSDLLLARLRENEGILDDASALLTRMVQEEVRITPAAEWLLDNYYLVEEQIRTARRHLPRGYSRELPSLSGGPSDGLPRVYDLAMEAIAHGDGRIDAETMTRFVAAYQAVAPLKLGELWAIPIMLRLALIENLRRMAVRVMRDGSDYRLAGEWARLLNDTADDNPKDVVLVVADMARSAPPMSGSFVAELTRGLQGRSAALAMPVSWIEQWVAASGHGTEDLVQAESQQQAADQVSISNTIGSLRFVANMDWREFVETMSVVEQALREDPAGVYARMDFNTRDAYRHVVEKVARQSGASETEVAGEVLRLAREAAAPHDLRAHVGYYVVDEGVAQLKAAIAASGPSRGRVRLGLRRMPLPVYLLPIAVVAAAFTWALLAEARTAPGWPPAWLLGR